MIKEQQLYLEIAQVKNLPPLPAESIKIISAVNNPDIDVEELADVLSKSPAIMARLLGLANSAFFGYTGVITDLRVAIIRVLGLNLVKSLALSIVLNVELDTSKCKEFDADYFWNHALFTAHLAQKLSVHNKDEFLTSSIVYTAGLLLNIGLLAAVHLFPSEINETLLQSDQMNESVSTQMFKSFGLTQYDLGGLLLQKWKLPNIYQTTVKQYLQPEYQGEERTLLDLLQLTHSISYYIVTDTIDDMPDFSELLNRLCFSQETVTNVVADVLKNKDNIKELATIISG